MQVYISGGVSYRFIHDNEVLPVHEEYGATVFQAFITRVLRNQYLYISFRFPQLGYWLCGFQIFIIQSQSIMYGSLPEPVAQLHHFRPAGIDVRTGVGEQVLAVKPHFESTVIRLTMPETFRTGFYYHLCSIHSPGIAEYKETWLQETFRHIIR